MSYSEEWRNASRHNSLRCFGENQSATSDRPPSTEDPKQAPASPLREALERQEKMLHELRSRMHEFEERLQPVLRITPNAPQQTDGCGEASDPSESRMVSFVNANTAMLHHIIFHLDDIEGRLQA